MQACHVVEIVTPKKFVLNGLWFGSKKPKMAIIWIHGLTSSAFSKLSIVEKLISSDTAVMTFNNRGHDSVTRISKVNGKKSLTAGAAFERFEDCIDDIQGAIDFARKRGAREIYLAGHSTGCQKAAYWASKSNAKNSRAVKGIILLAPMSDYAGMLKKYGAAKLSHYVATARAMLKSGKGDQLLELSGWTDEPNTPARFISLYTPDSVEQSIFSYFDEKRPSKVLSKIRIPILTILAEKDEYADRSAEKIMAWFQEHKGKGSKTVIVPKVGHGFKGGEQAVVRLIRAWTH